MLAQQEKKAYKGLPLSGLSGSTGTPGTPGSTSRTTIKPRRAWLSGCPPASDVLEVAPGPGYFAVALAKLGSYHIVGLDISETFVKIATDNARAAGVDVEFRHGNASSMPFESGSFDFVYCRAAFKNFSEPIRAIEEMYRVSETRRNRCDRRPAQRHDGKGNRSRRVSDGARAVKCDVDPVDLQALPTQAGLHGRRVSAHGRPDAVCDVRDHASESIGMEISLRK